MLSIHHFKVLFNHLLSLNPHVVCLSSKLGWLAAIWDAPDHLSLTFLDWVVFNFVHLIELWHFALACSSILRLRKSPFNLACTEWRLVVKASWVLAFLRGRLQKSEAVSLVSWFPSWTSECTLVVLCCGAAAPLITNRGIGRLFMMVTEVWCKQAWRHNCLGNVEKLPHLLLSSTELRFCRVDHLSLVVRCRCCLSHHT